MLLLPMPAEFQWTYFSFKNVWFGIEKKNMVWDGCNYVCSYCVVKSTSGCRLARGQVSIRPPVWRLRAHNLGWGCVFMGAQLPHAGNNGPVTEPQGWLGEGYASPTGQLG